MASKLSPVVLSLFCRRLYSPFSKSSIFPTSISAYRALSTKQSLFIRRAFPLFSLASVPVRSLSILQIENKEDFDTQVLKSEIPVIVQFHATWCRPCKMLAPRLEKMIARTDFANKFSYAKIDIDQNDDLASRYRVEAVPTVIAFVGGRAVDKFTGVVNDDALEVFLRKTLNAVPPSSS
jgi:thioredoxin